MPRLIISNIDYLVTVDPSRRIIRDGALVIQNGRVVAVGKTSEFQANPGNLNTDVGFPDICANCDR